MREGQFGGLILWAGVAALGLGSLSVLIWRHDAPINALWLVTAALCTYAIAYRFYGKFLATRVLRLEASRPTPAIRHPDGLDYVPTHPVVLFGHHFAAIAGAGPLVGPVLAAQMGFLPGTLWILVGVVFAGAVQDFVILFLSVRRDGKSLGHMIRAEMGPVAGLTASVGLLSIMVILLAVLALVVVKALANSPWGCCTVFCTLPIALAMGLYARFVHPGQVLQTSLAGLAALLGAIWLGGAVAADPIWAARFTFAPVTLAWMLIGYGFVAAALPVWLILAPRDYLSTFLKLGTIGALALGILWVRPVLQMPALTRFIDGTGPVFSGPIFPFLFITIACGAVSGFHALVASGTTPKMLGREDQARAIGYGAMLAESAVAIMALVAACVLQPGAYFAMNAPPGLVGADVATVATHITAWGFNITGDQLTALAHQVGEISILGRSGGAPTLAVGMAQIFAGALGGPRLMAFWYHFAILFEALFILTTIDAGTRVARFMFQDFARQIWPGFAALPGWATNGAATGLAVAGWGVFLLQGVTDPLGGINTLWPLFGIANQMLAAIALILASVCLFKMKRGHYAATTLAPAAWLCLCTLTAGWQKLFSPIPAIGFGAHAAKFAAALSLGQVLAPAKNLGEMRAILHNDQVDRTVIALFMAVVLVMVLEGARQICRARRDPRISAQEVGDDGLLAAKS